VVHAEVPPVTVEREDRSDTVITAVGISILVTGCEVTPMFCYSKISVRKGLIKGDSDNFNFSK
jgi:hypothetical protein